jgi:F420-dependent oxidoreductase-like protein
MVEGQEDVTWDQWLALAEATERTGLDGLFRSDHYLSGDGRVGRGSLDAWTTLAGIAAHTSRIRLGTMVSPATFRHPSVLGRSATTVDHISGGRIELGLGAGWFQMEHDAFGFPFPPMNVRMEMLEEQLEIVTRQWTEAEFSFDGAHYALDRCPALPRPLQLPHPPVIVGGAGKPRTVAMAVRFAQEYNVVSGDVDECRAVRERLDRACDAAGRDPATLPLSVMTTTVVGADAPELGRRLDDLAALGFDRTGAELLRENRDEWIAGTVPEVLEKLHALSEVGVQRAMLQHLCHTDVEMVELIGNALVPGVAAA